MTKTSTPWRILTFLTSSKPPASAGIRTCYLGDPYENFFCRFTSWKQRSNFSIVGLHNVRGLCPYLREKLLIETTYLILVYRCKTSVQWPSPVRTLEMIKLIHQTFVHPKLHMSKLHEFQKSLSIQLSLRIWLIIGFYLNSHFCTSINIQSTLTPLAISQFHSLTPITWIALLRTSWKETSGQQISKLRSRFPFWDLLWPRSPVTKEYSPMQALCKHEV